MRVWSGILFAISLFFLIGTFVTTGAFAIGVVSPPVGVWGTVHVDGVPVGMAITLDGVSYGVVPDSGVLVMDQIPLGGHTLGATMPGYQGKETPITVLDGQITKVRVELTAISTGTLTVDSNPTNVQVYLDDVYKGITPVTLTGVQAGSYTILLRLAGYQDWSSPVTVRPGDQEIVSGTLERTGLDSRAAQPVASSTPASASPPGIALLGVFIAMAGVFFSSRR